jgi:ADP-ribose pyrophosphatase
MKKVITENAILVPENATKLFSGVIFDVYQWEQELFDGSHTTFEMLKRTDTVSTICIVDDKLVVLDEKQPLVLQRKSFPGGRVDHEDDSILAAAKREVLEETGYTFSKYKLIRVNQPSIEIEWFVYLLVAWDVEGKTEPSPDSGEDIKLSLIAFEEVKDMVMEDKHLGHNRDIFEKVNSIVELLNLPDYEGKQVDR